MDARQLRYIIDLPYAVGPYFCTIQKYRSLRFLVLIPHVFLISLLNAVLSFYPMLSAGEVDFYLTQFLTSHGYFRDWLIT